MTNRRTGKRRGGGREARKAARAAARPVAAPFLTRALAPIDLVGDATGNHGALWGSAELVARPPRADLAPDPALPADTRLWAALQHASGGVWGGCVYDPDLIAAKLSGK